MPTLEWGYAFVLSERFGQPGLKQNIRLFRRNGTHQVSLPENITV